ncbi:MAG: hypothetical protein NZO16_02255 [Deltaproteobacteria bacterium]|nr:hypothetical protein [Deltaproteobacteria bacterium]
MSSKTLVIPFVLFLASFLLTVFVFLVLRHADSKAPTINLALKSQYMSKNNFHFSGEVMDFISGVISIKIKLEQGPEHLELLNIQLDKEKRHRFDVRLTADKLTNFNDGTANIVVIAVDGSSRANSVTKTYEIKVDSRAPTVNILAKPRSVQTNTAFLCFFSISDDSLIEVSLRDGFDHFVVLSASEYDSVFSKDLYVSVFTGNEFIMAVDRAGNVSEVPCSTAVSAISNLNQLRPDFNANLVSRIDSEIRALNTNKLQTKRLFDEIGLRFIDIPHIPFIRFGDILNESTSSIGIWVKTDKANNIFCPTRSQVEAINAVGGSNAVVLNIGFGIRIVLWGLEHVFLSSGSSCDSSTILGKSRIGEFGIFSSVRGKFVNPNVFFDRKSFLNNFTLVSAQAKKTLGNLPLTAVESSLLR